jgi:hypothetical protein
MKQEATKQGRKKHMKETEIKNEWRGRNPISTPCIRIPGSVINREANLLQLYLAQVRKVISSPGFFLAKFYTYVLFPPLLTISPTVFVFVLSLKQ